LSDPDPTSRPSLRASAASPAARLGYTVRAGLAAGITTAIWQGFDLTHGIWLTISAVVVIQPHRGDT
jgi:uncharacterized membrane protein YccC